MGSSSLAARRSPLAAHAPARAGSSRAAADKFEEPQAPLATPPSPTPARHHGGNGEDELPPATRHQMPAPRKQPHVAVPRLSSPLCAAPLNRYATAPSRKKERKRRKEGRKERKKERRRRRESRGGGVYGQFVARR